MLSQNDFNRKEKDSQGQSRKKEGLAQIPCEIEGQKPHTSFPTGSLKIQLSSKLKPSTVRPKTRRPWPRATCPSAQPFSQPRSVQGESSSTTSELLPRRRLCGESRLLVLVTHHKALHQIPLLLWTSEGAVLSGLGMTAGRPQHLRILDSQTVNTSRHPTPPRLSHPYKQAISKYLLQRQ